MRRRRARPGILFSRQPAGHLHLHRDCCLRVTQSVHVRSKQQEGRTVYQLESVNQWEVTTEVEDRQEYFQACVFRFSH